VLNGCRSGKLMLSLSLFIALSLSLSTQTWVLTVKCFSGQSCICHWCMLLETFSWHSLPSHHHRGKSYVISLEPYGICSNCDCNGWWVCHTAVLQTVADGSVGHLCAGLDEGGSCCCWWVLSVDLRDSHGVDVALSWSSCTCEARVCNWSFWCSM